jgi:hypothetical protein
MEDIETYDELVEKLTTRQRRVYSVLGTGQARSIKSERITRITGINGKEIRYLIHQIITKKGINISSNMNGYFIPANEIELEDATKGLSGRAIDIMNRAVALQKNNRYFPSVDNPLEMTRAENENEIEQLSLF